jgi:hypothetical protein
VSRQRVPSPRVPHEAERCKRPDGSEKASYRSSAKARRAIRDHRHRDVPLYVYECPRCGLWHITSRPQ